MTQHSTSTTKRYEFGCGKKFHVKTSIEKDGTMTFSLVGERNGTCSGVMMQTIIDLLNLYAKYGVEIGILEEICKGHQCSEAVPGFKSCMDKVARDISKTIKEQGVKNG